MVILFFVGLVIYLTTITPSVQGDGHEYIMQTVAFQNHLSFGISPEDFEEAKSQFYNNQEGLIITYTHPVAVIRDERGWAYSNHFGAYSAIVTVVKLILLKLNIYPLWAFSITNLILWMAAVLVVLFFLKVDDKRKFCILILLMLNPIFFYLDWVHTEVYIFTFEVIGLVFLYNKQYARSILALSISAMQNVGMLPIAAIAGISYILDCYDKYVIECKDRNVGRFILAYYTKIVPYGFLYLPAFYPIITTYLRFGVINRVAAVAMENKYLLHKALDYLFDPNLGIFPYEPIILTAFIILIILGIKKHSKDAILNLSGVIGILFIISHQTQINSGMQEIMRYCIWIIPVMIFYVVLHWHPTAKWRNGLITATILESLFTAAIISYCVWFGGAYSYCEFANWTKVLIDVAPQIYNPTHGIFYSRASGIEAYHYPVPVIYENEQGYVRKILLSKEAYASFFDDSLFFLMDDSGNLIDKNDFKGHKVDEGDYIYYNFNGKIRCLERSLIPDDGIVRLNGEDYVENLYIIDGISLPDKETTATWTLGAKMLAFFNVDDNTTAETIHVSMDLEGVIGGQQDVLISINGTDVFQEIVTAGENAIRFDIPYPSDGNIFMTVNIPDAVSPLQLGISDDPRELGLMISTIKFVIE